MQSAVLSVGIDIVLHVSIVFLILVYVLIVQPNLSSTLIGKTGSVLIVVKHSKKNGQSMRNGEERIHIRNGRVRNESSSVIEWRS